MIDKNLHKVFLVTSLTIGTLIVILVPKLAYITWDESIHYNRTKEIFNSGIKMGVDEIFTNNTLGYTRSFEDSKNLNEYINSNSKIINEGNKNSNFIVYHRYVYVPSAIIMKLGRFIGLSNIIVFMLGKLTNLFIYSFIIYYAIKIAKVGKRLLFVIGLLPTGMFQACSYSADSIIISCLALAIVVFINEMIEKEKKLSSKSVCLFILAMIFGSFPKAVYIPLILLPLIMPSTKFKNKNQEIKFKICIILLFILVMATFGLNIVFNIGDMSGDQRGGDTSYPRQAMNIIKHPLGFIYIIITNILMRLPIKTLYESFSKYAYLGSIDINLYIINLIALIYALFSEKKDLKSKFSIKTRLSIIALCSIIIFGINLSMYLSFTPVGSMHINGVQSRYYLPLLFPILICLNDDKIKIMKSEKFNNMLISILCSSVLLISIYFQILVPFNL